MTSLTAASTNSDGCGETGIRRVASASGSKGHQGRLRPDEQVAVTLPPIAILERSSRLVREEHAREGCTHAFERGERRPSAEGHAANQIE